MLKSIRTLIDQYENVYIMSHSDLDGIMSAMVVKKYCASIGKSVKIQLNSYNNIDERLLNLKLNSDTLLIITDIFPKDATLLLRFVASKQIIVIDHHETSADFYNPKRMFFNVPSHDTEGMCGALLSYSLFECGEIKCLKDICEITNAYDLWQLKSPLRQKSEQLNMLFQRYWEKMADMFIDGRTEFNKEEQAFIDKELKLISDTYKSLEYFDIDDIKEIPGYFFVSPDYINECCERTFKDKPEIKVCFAYSPKSDTLSVRSVLDEVNIGEILTRLQYGGGHKKAAGIRTNGMDIEKMVKMIKTVMVEIKKYYDIAVSSE